MNRATTSWIAALALIVSAGAFEPVRAQTGPSCSDPNSHQFDFWIGSWEVHAGETLAGHSTIEPILDGCVLQESWQGASGSAGTSLNFYNPQTETWHQLWVWRNGTTLDLEGGLEGDQMILEGVSRDRDGNPVSNRITWTPKADGTVRQLWETSSDEGRTWSTAFDGMYRRRK